MRKMTPEEERIATELFRMSDMPPPHKGEGETHLTVRFDNSRPGVVYWGPHAQKGKVRIPGSTVLRYTIDPTARTPTGGRWVRQSLVVRTRDGKKWRGVIKRGTDVVVLHRIYEQEKGKEGRK